MLFQNKYNRFPRQYEKPSGISKVEVAGYIPAKTKIESLIQAGARLIQSRKEQYDYPPGTDVTGDEPMDPTRRPGFDMVDASIMEKALEARIEARIQLEKLKAIELDKEASKAVLEASKTVLDDHQDKVR